MTNLKNTSAIALAALLAASPMAALAGTETGSPQQSVDADPDEYAEDGSTVKKPVTEMTESGSPQQAVDNDADEQVAGNETDGEGTIADELPTGSPQVSGG